MRTILRLIEISRPIFWPSTFFAFLIGVTLAGGHITFPSLFFATLWSFPFSLWICAANDLADKEFDTKNPFKGGLSGAQIKGSETRLLQFSLISTFLVIVIPTLLLKNFPMLAVSFSALLLPYIYSLYPFRLKERPPLDSLANGGFVASVFLAGVFFTVPHLTGTIVQAASAFFLGVSAIHILGALRDYSFDKKSKVKTIAVVFGQKLSAFIMLVLFSGVFLVIRSFPLEFRIFTLVAIGVSIFLFIHPGEKQSAWSGLILLLLFFLTSLYSLLFGSLLSLIEPIP